MVTTSKILVKIGDEYLDEGSGYCDFGEVPMYESSELVLTVENSGYSSLQISSISAISGDKTQFFMDVTSLISQISAGSSTTFSLVFKPTSTGYRSAIFRIESSDGESFTFTAIGYGKSNTFEPDIQVKQDTDDLPFQYGMFDFGHVLLTHSSTPVVFTIENTGTGELTIHSINFVSGDTDQFHIIVYPLNIVSGGENTTFSITFDPSSLGYKSTILSIESNDPDENPYEVTLEGYGDSQLVPDISVPKIEPKGSYDFGKKKVGDTQTEEFKIKNNGTGDLMISSVQLISGDTSQFTIDLSQMSSRVAPGDETKCYIHFTPTIAGDVSASVAIHSNDPDEKSYTFTLYGYGELAPIPDIKVLIGKTEYPDGSTYDFGTVFTSKTKTFTIENVGTDELIIQNILLMEGDTDFILDLSYTFFTLSPDEQTFMLVKFDPKGMGDKWRNLVINCNDPNENPYNIRLEGNY